MEHVRVALFVDLPRPGDGHPVGRNVLVNGAPRGGEPIVLDVDRGHQDAARPDEGVVSDFAMEFVDPVVIGDDGSAADIDQLRRGQQIP